jgi:hypothetical protein
MTIAIAVAVPDGIALAADTQTTWTRTITHAVEKGTGNQFELESPIALPIGWSKSARKLFSISMQECPYAVAVAGAALINNKTPYSIVKSLEQSYRGSGTYEDVLSCLFEGLKAELRLHFGVADLTQAPQVLALNFILAGYEGHDVSRPILRAVGVYSGRPAGIPDPTGDQTSWANNGPLRFNCCWTGRGEFVSHVVSHGNAALPQISGQYSLLTLADAVDYVRFLAEFTCDFQRFAVMVPDCGRPVMAATLTPDGFVERPGI